MKKVTTIIPGLLIAAVLIVSCKKDTTTSSTLKNEFIKRTVTPLIVGEKIEIAYGAGTTNSTLSSMEVTASIPGAAGTNFETVTHRTVNAVDLTKTVATSVVTKDAISTATLIDTNATTLRYIYF